MSAAGAGLGRALEAVMERVAVTAAAVGPRFPLYAQPEDGRWKTTGRGSWTGGFWAGLLWLRARYTGDEADRRAAAACTARLEPWVAADTATRGLIFWYGTAPAGDDAGAAALRARAARAVLSAHDRELGLVPWGTPSAGPDCSPAWTACRVRYRCWPGPDRRAPPPRPVTSTATSTSASARTPRCRLLRRRTPRCRLLRR